MDRAFEEGSFFKGEGVSDAEIVDRGTGGGECKFGFDFFSFFNVASSKPLVVAESIAKAIYQHLRSLGCSGDIIEGTGQGNG